MTRTNTRNLDEVSEAEFLALQACHAKHAMKRTLRLIGANAVHGIDPRVWTQQHPWTSLGAALVSGFATTAVLVPSARRRAMRAGGRIGQAASSHQSGDSPAPGTGATSDKSESSHRWVAAIVREAIVALRPAIAGGLASLLAARRSAEKGETSAPASVSSPAADQTTHIGARNSPSE